MRRRELDATARHVAAQLRRQRRALVRRHDVEIEPHRADARERPDVTGDLVLEARPERAAGDRQRDRRRRRRGRRARRRAPCSARSPDGGARDRSPSRARPGSPRAWPRRESTGWGAYAVSGPTGVLTTEPPSSCRGRRSAAHWSGETARTGRPAVPRAGPGRRGRHAPRLREPAAGGAIPRARPQTLGRRELPFEEVQPPDRVLPARGRARSTSASTSVSRRAAGATTPSPARSPRPTASSISTCRRGERLVQRSPGPLSQETSSASSGSVAAPSSSSRCASERVPTAARTRTGWLRT